VLAYAFYGQGTRFLDVTDPKDIRQVGYYRPNGASTWAPYFHGGLVYVADNSRGVDIVRFTGGPVTPEVPEPPPALSLVELPMDDAFAGMCALPASRVTIG